MGLYFIRHGESESNERNLFAGRFDTPLTALGRRQALQARALVQARGLKFDEVHFTPLSRARETAEIIVTDPNVRRVLVPDLVERDFGLLSEQNKSLIKKHFGAEEFEKMFHSADGAPPAGESFEEMYVRVKAWYDDVLRPRELAGQTILVVAHKYIVEMFALIAAGLEPKDYHDFRVPNCKPCSWVDLQKCVATTSVAVNHAAEVIEARLAAFLLLASLAGVALRLLSNHALPTAVFTALVGLLLAVNSGVSLLRLETTVFRRSLSSLGRIWKGFLPRALAGFALVIFAPNAWVAAAGSFLLLPSAMTGPTLSLMWGGDYFLNFQATLVLSVLSPVLLAAASLLGNGSVLDRAHLLTFILAIAFSVVLPGLIAQAYRQRRPIQAGALSTNWGWLGGAVLIPLASLAAYQFTPSRAEIAHSSLASWLLNAVYVIGLLLALRIFAFIATRITQKNARANLDRYVAHIAPNIFFWFTLLPVGVAFSQVRLLTTVFFFASIYLEEKRFVRRFAQRLGLASQRDQLEAQPELQTA